MMINFEELKQKSIKYLGGSYINVVEVVGVCCFVSAAFDANFIVMGALMVMFGGLSLYARNRIINGY